MAYRSLLERARLFDRQPALKSAIASDSIPADAVDCEEWTRRLFGGRKCYHPRVSFEELVREAFRRPVNGNGEQSARCVPCQAATPASFARDARCPAASTPPCTLCA